VSLIVDCSTRGEGIVNKESYEELGISAIFQNGEEEKDIGEIFYPGLSFWKKKPRYLKIPLCSGLAAIKVAKVIKQIANIKYLYGFHCKVSNTARMLTMNYEDSNYQIHKLLGIDSNMGVIYLRGEPARGIFSYHGWLEIEMDRVVVLDKVLDLFSKRTNYAFRNIKRFCQIRIR